MIPVVLAQEPADFERVVRQPGLSAIDELVGRTPRLRRGGQKRGKVADVESAIPAASFPPFWRFALDDMMVAYHQRCAYLAVWIEVTGNPTVDHVAPVSQAWDKVYEWSNYRLCTGVVNAKKGTLADLVDPVHVGVGWFALDLSSYSVVRAATAPAAYHRAIDRTLPLLNLPDCCKLRQQYVEDYWRGPDEGGISLAYLERRAPFVAAELRRQSELVRGDA